MHSLLVGALLAMLLERRRLGVAGPEAGVISAHRRVALFGSGSGVRDLGDDELGMYRGGFLLFAVGVAT